MDEVLPWASLIRQLPSLTVRSVFTLLLIASVVSSPASAVDQGQSTAQPGNNSLVGNHAQNSQEELENVALASPAKDPLGDKDILHAQPPPNGQADHKHQLTPNALQLAKMLNIGDTMAELKSRAASSIKSRDDTVDLMLLREKLSRAIQYASLELEEALANIDGDLATANMQYAYFSAKHDRAVLLNNVAAFTSSGGLGVLDSSTGIRYGAPIPNIFGITGNALAVGIPLLGLIPPKYKVPTHTKHHEGSGNMLAPIFGRDYAGSGYDPIVWNYLEAVPADSKTSMTRIQTLLKSWQAYRGLNPKDAKSKQTIDILTDVAPKDKKISIDLFKTKTELLVELRAQVQQMYKDISDLNTCIMDTD